MCTTPPVDCLKFSKEKLDSLNERVKILIINEKQVKLSYIVINLHQYC